LGTVLPSPVLHLDLRSDDAAAGTLYMDGNGGTLSL